MGLAFSNYGTKASHYDYDLVNKSPK